MKELVLNVAGVLYIYLLFMGLLLSCVIGIGVVVAIVRLALS